MNELFSNRDDSVAIATLFGVHIPSAYRSLRIPKEFIKRSLRTWDGFKSEWPCFAIGFFSPVAVIPAVGVDNLDFVLQGSFKPQLI